MKIKSIILSLIAGALLFSCASTNDVVGGGIIQKRKYNDGYYISLNKKFNKKSESNASTGTEISADEIELVENEDFSLEENNTTNQETPEIGQTTENISVQVELPNTAETISTPEKSKPEIAKTENKVEVDITNNYIPKKIETITKGMSGSSADAMLILLVILCFFIPPLAVFLFEGASSRFWIDLILFIIGIAIVGWLLLGISGLALLVSVIYALLIVLSVI